VRRTAIPTDLPERELSGALGCPAEPLIEESNRGNVASFHREAQKPVVPGRSMAIDRVLSLQISLRRDTASV
jgi:hypothetical protein